MINPIVKTSEGSPLREKEAPESDSERIEDLEVGGSSYGIYSALLTQSSTNAPTANVKETTLEAVIDYTYDDVGVYNIVSDTPIFTETNFTFIQGAGNASTLLSLWVYYIDASTLKMEVYDLGNVGAGFETKDDVMLNQFIEIRVYTTI